MPSTAIKTHSFHSFIHLLPSASICLRLLHSAMNGDRTMYGWMDGWIVYEVSGYLAASTWKPVASWWHRPRVPVKSGFRWIRRQTKSLKARGRTGDADDAKDEDETAFLPQDDCGLRLKSSCRCRLTHSAFPVISRIQHLLNKCTKGAWPWEPYDALRWDHFIILKMISRVKSYHHCSNRAK